MLLLVLKPCCFDVAVSCFDHCHWSVCAGSCIGVCVFIMHSLPFKSLLTCIGISTYESFGNSAPKVEFSPPPNQRGRKFYLTAQIC